MRLGWHVHLFGPIGVGGTIWRSRRRRPRRKVYRGTLPDGWSCPHNHTREDTATVCAEREARRRVRLGDDPARYWAAP
jgi:hypothetical protein